MPEKNFESIKAAYAEEEAVAHHRTLTGADLPFDYDEITPAWMTEILGFGDGADVVSCEVGPPSEGTSSRRRISLTWNDAGQAAGLPATVFAKATMGLGSRYMLGLNGGVAAEVGFYTTVKPLVELRTPDAIFARYDPDTFNSIVVMWDIGDRVTFGTCEMDLDEAQARSQLRLLARLHAAFWESDQLDTTLSDFNRWERFFDVTIDAAGFGEACPRGFDLAEDVIPARLFARKDEVWPATLRSVEEHSRLPRMLIHSDNHLGNWFFDADGEMGLNDWQCACKGNWGRDVAYALATALTVEHRRAWERDLLAYYLDQLREAGAPAPDGEEAWGIYRRNLFSVLAWWTGTLGQPPDAPAMQPPATSREFIRRITHAIDDTDALDAFGAGDRPTA